MLCIINKNSDNSLKQDDPKAFNISSAKFISCSAFLKSIKRKKKFNSCRNEGCVWMPDLSLLHTQCPNVKMKMPVPYRLWIAAVMVSNASVQMKMNSDHKRLWLICHTVKISVRFSHL